MYPLFRKTVEKIITQAGGVPLQNFYDSDEQTIVLGKPNFDDFLVHKQGSLLRVGYHRKGDRKADPIFVFRINEGVWYPFACEQVLLHTRIGDLNETMRYEYRPRALRDVKTFASACAREWQFYYLK